MRDTDPPEHAAGSGQVSCACVAVVAAMFAAHPHARRTNKRADSRLYSTVSIFPPTAQRMTVCYGFVCRRREISISRRATATR
jgi:hypothetical protein